jgi:hypothetical protein
VTHQLLVRALQQAMLLMLSAAAALPRISLLIFSLSWASDMFVMLSAAKSPAVLLPACGATAGLHQSLLLMLTAAADCCC